MTGGSGRGRERKELSPVRICSVYVRERGRGDGENRIL